MRVQSLQLLLAAGLVVLTVAQQQSAGPAPAPAPVCITIPLLATSCGQLH